MALLDHFRAQPRQKHPDAAVRLAFVQEIPIDEREVVAEMAREDPDARVRRAAVAKLMDPAALSSVAERDADEAVRNDAVTMLRDIALDAFEGVDESVSLAAVEAIGDPRVLASIAKAALREPIAARALERVSDARARGSVARHAPLEPIRRAALETLSDRGEILNVAMNSEFKDTAVAAVERLVDGHADLEQIATRARNKSAAKRARGILRETDERAAAEAAATAQAPGAELPLAHAEASTPESEEAAATREQLAAAQREQAAEAARQLEEARAAEWLRHQESEALARQQAEQERQKDLDRRLSRMAELAQEAEVAAADEDLQAAKRRLDIIRREWRDVSAGVPSDPALAGRYGEAQLRIETRGRDAEAQAARARQEALARLHQLLARVEPLGTRADMSLKAGERALRDIRAALADVPPLPSRQEYDAVTHRLKAAQAALIPKVQDLRDAADWQRWANVGVQEQLCQKMEALRELEDPEHIAREVRVLQEQWRQAADAPRAQGETLWRRFKTAHDEVWSRCEAFFAAQARERAENLAKKVALSERVEALAESTNWIETSEEIKRLQAEWKTIGPVARGQEKASWERFRGACDRFFTRRQADLAERKKVWSDNLAKKEALCVKVEALAESTDWDQAAAEIRRLQTEWKTIGAVKKTRSDAIWQRFRAASDRFFVRFSQRHEIARADRIAAREAICAELEALAPADVASSPDLTAESSPAPAAADVLAQVRALQGRWQQEIAARGVDRERAVQLDARFQAAFHRVLSRFPEAFAGTDLDPDANRKRMEGLVKRMEDLANSVAGPEGAAASDAALSPTAKLAAMLKEALAANTIGGKVDDASRLMAAVEDVRHAQSSWSRIGPVSEDTRRALAGRFERASRRITERARGSIRAGEPGRGGGSGVSGRSGGTASFAGSRKPGPPNR